MIKREAFLLLLALIVLNCNNDIVKPMKANFSFDDSYLILNNNYEKGDVRRYGIYPDSINNKKHPETNKSIIQSILDYAEDSGQEIFFPKGFYSLNLFIDFRNNINLKFDKAIFNSVNITGNDSIVSSNINLKGTLILNNTFGVYHSNNITIDSLIITTDKQKNIDGYRSKGCHIYKGTKNLIMRYLHVDDLGSGAPVYKNNHAALTLDGFRNNPENITIDEVIIESSDRHGAYITGKNNIIKQITIKKYAQGTTNGMSGMQNTEKGEEHVLSGLWINKCNDCEFIKVKIETKLSNAIPLKLDGGDANQPTIMHNLILDVAYKDAIVLDDILTNVLVKKIEIID